MWETEPNTFRERFRVSDRAVWFFRCTAEHLVAQCDGGGDTEENIVAACQFCNGSRHRKKRPKDAASYASFVRSRIEKGRWHPVPLTHQQSDAFRDDTSSPFLEPGSYVLSPQTVPN
ncbi:MULTISPECIES: HNH endonuclease [unclassified Rhizobium]|uniref:HNH endonuclease n=1 Tax=unclassified Rhizobium TaxID=2613769 RepID=UPI0007F105B4|nr:HNH endonuclease protein [Rhizobium sp. N6212]ANK97569.1 HNH endonuclease protein [Rhizobium sp. N621]